MERVRVLAELGENVRLARKRRGLSAVLMAERAGLSRPTLRAIERGDPGVRPERQDQGQRTRPIVSGKVTRAITEHGDPSGGPANGAVIPSKAMSLIEKSIAGAENDEVWVGTVAVSHRG